MPKDEFDFEDPMELNGVALVSPEDTTEAMTECFVEEFMRLGHNHKQILALFRNPHYLGMNMALQNRGEQFVRDKISEVFARWGRPVKWATAGPPEPVGLAEELRERTAADPEPGCAPGERSQETDPMGAPIPDITL